MGNDLAERLRGGYSEAEDHPGLLLLLQLEAHDDFLPLNEPLDGDSYYLLLLAEELSWLRERVEELERRLGIE